MTILPFFLLLPSSSSHSTVEYMVDSTTKALNRSRSPRHKQLAPLPIKAIHSEPRAQDGPLGNRQWRQVAGGVAHLPRWPIVGAACSPLRRCHRPCGGCHYRAAPLLCLPPSRTAQRCLFLWEFGRGMRVKWSPEANNRATILEVSNFILQHLDWQML